MTPQRWRLAAIATVLVWCVAMLALRRTADITDDWQGWRQADTQAIARNFAVEEANPLYPRIDWRGDGPGYVESEAQLYPAIVGAVLRVTGDSVWPGQLLSLACIALAALVIFLGLARRFGEAAAFLALIATLTMQGAIVASTSIQPDPLAFLGFTVGWFGFLDWLDAPSRRRLALWIAATALAGLVKPTTLELGLAQGVYVLLAHRRALRDPKLWLGWAIVVGAVVGYLVHARTLYVDHGNTFGIFSGGDSKLPAGDALRASETWRELARYAVVWGVGLLAVPAAIYLAARRRLDPAPIALAVGAVALDLIALRYTSGPFGTHYHLPHVVLGAWLVAQAARSLAQYRPRWLRPIASLAVALALVAAVRALRFVRRQPPQPETAIGLSLRAAAAPGTLVVVRARAERYNHDWHTANNFEDPRVFYLSRTKGWVLANDDAGAARLADYAARGARFYAHVAQKPIDAELAAWLAAHATLVGPVTDDGALYALDRL